MTVFDVHRSDKIKKRNQTFGHYEQQAEQEFEGFIIFNLIL